MQPPGTDDKIKKMEPDNQNLLKEAQKEVDRLRGIVIESSTSASVLPLGPILF